MFFNAPNDTWSWRLANLSGAIVLLACLSAKPAVSETVARPNIVWIMSEDNSKHYLRHFDRDGVETPAIQALAEHGVTFDRAFSNAPVCSVARSTLITGGYAPRLGIQYHRKMKLATLPSDLEMFPAYLRAAGYYTTNQSKQDYNAEMRAEPWDASSKKASWMNRPTPETPFFHVETHTDSHESRLHFDAKTMENVTEFSQEDVVLPPYFPDTKTFRFTAAYYRDRMNVIDGKVRQTIKQLEQQGQLDNTFVFYFGDHGGVLPRSKGYLFESGLHVPLIVRVPERYADLVDGRELGSRTDGFVSFIDFAPTVLQLAGVEVPDKMDGKAFLGPDVEAAEVDQRNTTFGYADRMDAKYDFVRSVRVGDWKYIRYFEAHYPNALENQYRYKMLAYQQWREFHEQGKLDETQTQFFQSRPVEVLYDLASDPHEVNDLSEHPAHAQQLSLLRATLAEHMKSTNDLSLVPEALFIAGGLSDPVAFGSENAASLAEYLDTVNLALLPWTEAKPKLLAAINSGDAVVRYWALVAVSSMAATDARIAAEVRSDTAMMRLIQRRTLDDEPLVCGRAAELLATLRASPETTGIDVASVLTRSVARSTSPAEALQLMNMAVYVDSLDLDSKPFAAEDFSFLFEISPKGELQRRLDYFSRQ